LEGDCWHLREEILDLMAYILSGANLRAPVFGK
jgi:hypothetical protein